MRFATLFVPAVAREDFALVDALELPLVDAFELPLVDAFDPRPFALEFRRWPFAPGRAEVFFACAIYLRLDSLPCMPV